MEVIRLSPCDWRLRDLILDKNGQGERSHINHLVSSQYIKMPETGTNKRRKIIVAHSFRGSQLKIE